MISTNKLCDIYTNWGYKNKIETSSSAEDVMRKDDLTNEQFEWLFRFIELWQITEHKERKEK
jgi:hypothetical protein